MIQKILFAGIVALMLASCVMPAPSQPDFEGGANEAETLLGPVGEQEREIIITVPGIQPETASGGSLQTGEVFSPSFVIQNGTPLATGNILNPEAGCNWMGVGGQVFGADGVPVTGLVVEVEGMLGGREVSLLSLTGSAQNLGPGGFGMTLNDQPVATNDSLSIRLFDSEGVPLTDRRTFDTYADCARNMILINFIEIPGGVRHRFYLPLILRQRTDAMLPLIQGP